jgi:hypothetical protein
MESPFIRSVYDRCKVLYKLSHRLFIGDGGGSLTMDESTELGKLGDCVRHGTVHMLQDLCQPSDCKGLHRWGESDTWRKSIVVHARGEV